MRDTPIITSMLYDANFYFGGGEIPFQQMPVAQPVYYRFVEAIHCICRLHSY